MAVSRVKECGRKVFRCDGEDVRVVFVRVRGDGVGAAGLCREVGLGGGYKGGLVLGLPV